MKNTYITMLMVVLAMVSNAQEATIERPESGQTQYTVTGSETLEATDAILLKETTLIQPTSGNAFIARIIDLHVPNDPYGTFAFSDENYVFTRLYQTPYQQSIDNVSTGVKEADVFENITYFDGLGRPMQQIGIKASPSLKDIVTHIAYDDLGRQEKEFLPYETSTGDLGSFRTDALGATDTYYLANYADDLSNTAPNPFSQREFEPSPLNRVLRQAAPGEDWKLGNGHEIGFEYQTNGADEVRRFDVGLSFANNTYTPSLIDNNQYYVAGELYKNVTKDENHDGGTSKLHTTEEFADKEGRVVLKRTYALVGSVEEPHDTYYIYDDFGNLTYVLPPQVVISNEVNSVSQNELDDLSYQYVYDHRNRLVEKKIPGKGREYIVYNTLDLPIMTQDANLRANGAWLFTKYDAFGRVAYTGIDTGNTNDRLAVQSAADAETDQYETRTANANTYVNTDVYYSKTAYPTSFDQVYTINYYDGYVDTDGIVVPATVLGRATANNVQGLATVAKVRVLTAGEQWITMVTGYDQKGRAIYVHSKNPYLGTEDIVETELDFAGKVVRTETEHIKDGNAPIATTDTFTYDHGGRLLVHKQTIDDRPEETLVANTYDELGLLVQKQVGGGLQTVDYGYNVRGWLKNINNTSSLGNDLFAFDIDYNDPTNFGANENPQALFNGNISQVQWKTASANTTGNPVSERYSYSYDALNRITAATDNTGNYSLENVSYYKNGNIHRLKRWGPTILHQYGDEFGTIDDLQYTYESGNQLYGVQDFAVKDDDFGFHDVYNYANPDYLYDQNGNMVSDANKGITAITYNHLNLPTDITVSSAAHNGSISYIYDATGVKLQKTVGSSVTLYAGNYVYENGSLQFFGYPEGYVTPDGTGGYDYVYQYKDHLGNIRLSYTDDPSNPGTPTIIEESNYYPFGLRHKGYNNVTSPLGNSVAQRWKFGGKEYQDELGLNWYDVTARNYDPALGRWMNLDPLAEQMRRHSPYNYAFDNPVYFIDYDGMSPQNCCLNGPGNPLGHVVGLTVGLINAGRAFLDLPPINIEGNAKSDRFSGDRKRTSQEDRVTVVVSDSRGDNNDTTDAPTEFIDGDAMKTAAKSTKSSAGGMKFPSKKGPPKTGPSNKSTARSVMESGNKAKSGMQKGSKAVSATMDAANQKDSDTTFVTTQAGSIETQVVSSNQVSSFGNVKKVEVTVPKSKVDSVNNASQQSLNKQKQQMDAANAKLLDSLNKANNGY